MGIKYAVLAVGLSGILGGCASAPIYTPRGSTLGTICRRFQAPRAWAYCLTVTPNSRNTDILYALHGGGDDEATWPGADGYSEGIRRRWVETGRDAPAVASVSFGPYWLLRSSGTLTALLTERVMPEIEARLASPPRRRMVVGESMGGFNALQLAGAHPDVFVRAALLCPGIPTLSPYASESEVVSFVQRSKADRSQVVKAQMLMRAGYPTPQEWDEDGPQAALRRITAARRTSLYISCGRTDEYGFFDGAEALAAQARRDGADVTWQPLDGGHCTVSPNAVADFLSAP